MDYKKYLLAAFPPIALILAGFIPAGYSLVNAWFILYIMTIAMAKYRCKDESISNISKKSVAPLSYFIALVILGFIGPFIPILTLLTGLLNNVLGWFVVGLLYKITFEKLFSC